MNIIVYFIAYTMESFALWFYCNFISEQKKKNYINFLYIFLIYLLLWLFSFFKNVYLNLFYLR